MELAGKNIDYPISNRCIDCCNKRSEKLSDHCIVEFCFQFEVSRSEPALALSPCEFLSSSTVAHKQTRGTTCFHFCIWGSTEKTNGQKLVILRRRICDWDQFEDQEQMMVDYTWVLYMCEAQLCLQISLLACFFGHSEWFQQHGGDTSLFHIWPIAKGIRGVEVKQQRRTLPKMW